jgi:hypothetical protein
MPNLLQKLPQISEGGSGPGSPTFGDEGDDPKKPPLPPVGSKCYEDLFNKVLQLWPLHTVTHVHPDKGNDYLRVSSMFTGYVWGVTGACVNGYIEIRYWVIQSPGMNQTDL